MQNQQMAHMAAMNASNGPIDGNPIVNMANAKQVQPGKDPREQLNTYIYDYFMREGRGKVARLIHDSNMALAINGVQRTKTGGPDAEDRAALDDLPQPQLPQNTMAEQAFLLDWWIQFWDIYQATKNRTVGPKPTQYIQHTKALAHMQNEQRNQRMMMNSPMNGQYQTIMRSGGVPNGVAPNDLKRAAAMNNRPNGNPMAGMQMKNPAMMAAQMQRDPSGMDMNGQHPQSPGSNENVTSPNKRPRVDGGMNAGNMGATQFEFAQQGQNVQQQKIEVYAQSLANQHRSALNNTSSPQGMNSGVQGSPMAQAGLDGQHDMFAGNGPRTMPANAQGAPQQGNHALQDYQMQLMLLEQQNKKRLLMARQEQDNMAGPQQGVIGAPGFATAMSPQGSRAGPSPNPTDQMKRGTPKLNQQGLPGSPMPEGVMQQRGSPAPNMNFDPSLAPPGMPPLFYSQQQQQMSANPMMRPPSSHPGANFAAQQMTPQQQMENMRNNAQMPNGAWRGPPQQGMMPGQQQMGVVPMGQNPQQRNQMPPPPAPTNEQPRPEPSPSQSNQAPPAPSSTSKTAPKKKMTKDTKKPANKKGANASATPAAATNGDEPPTPTSSTPVAPITPVHKQSFNQGQNGQQPVQPQPAPQQSMDAPPFGNIDPDPGFDLGLNFSDDTGALENFDFDSFLHTGNDDNGFGNIVGDFDFTNTAEVGGDL